MAITTAKALEIAKTLRQYNDEELRFIRKISEDSGDMREWADAESELENMEDVHSSLESISWEDKQSEISDLCSEAYDQCTTFRDHANKLRGKLGIELRGE
jgi:hypothetical protein